MIDRFSLIWGVMIGMFTVSYFGLTSSEIFWFFMLLLVFDMVGRLMDESIESTQI